jgi:hypothetical protein
MERIWRATYAFSAENSAAAATSSAVLKKFAGDRDDLILP